MTERDRQQQEFFAEHERDLLTIARQLHWEQPGRELHNWTVHLLPDGYACPEDETYAELLNALQY